MYALFLLRTRILYGAVLLFALIFAGKLFLIQVLKGDEYRKQASEQYTTSTQDSFDRGSIFFSGDVFSAATIKTGYTIAINPSLIKDSQETFTVLKSLIPELNGDAFFLQAGKRDDPYEEIARRVPESVAQTIRKQNIPGVSVYRETWRTYPSNTVAAHSIGFVGYDGDTIRGRYGLERYYDDVLSRAEEKSVNLFAEAFANIKNSLRYDSREAGAGDLTLTVDYEVETFLEDTLEKLVDNFDARGGGAIIMNPQTGALYALAARPTFNPNLFSQEKNYSVFSNPLVESVFEMGSIVKPLTLAWGLDDGVIAPSSVYTDTGSVVVSGKTIANYDGKARGTIPVQEILNQSLNVGAVHVARKLGNERFSDHFFSFGLGEVTGIDLPNEAGGLVENLKTNRDVEIATASFGQGFAVTPISIVRALSALANGGFLVTPYVVESINYEKRLIPYVHRPEENRISVLRPETSETITRMLTKVVDEALLGGTVKNPHYSIAAKTGTAQIAKKGGGYYDDRFLHSFFGYFPAFDPQFIVFFYLLEPHGVRFASETLTKPFMEIVEFLIHYYKIPPDR